MNRPSHRRPTRLLLLTLGWVVVCSLSLTVRPSSASAHDGHDHPPRAAQPAEVYRPGLLPDRIILTWADDPATTQAVTWRTSTEVRKAKAEIAVAQGNPDFGKAAETVPASTELLETDLGAAHYHAVQFRGLRPGTRYAYRVGDGVNWSEWFQFSTASAKPASFSFIYFGDAQNDVRSLWSRVIREAYRDAPRARFMIHAGDLVNRAEADAEWGEWFGAGHWLNAMVPSIAVPGNHEQARLADGRDDQRRLSRHWRPQFTLPENGPPGLEETCYTLVYQDLRIIGLDSNREIDRQAEWLDEVLSKNCALWVVCTFHHPVFSTAKDRDNPHIRRAWKPVFDKHRVDLVLQGHDHTYGRTGLETPAVLPPTLHNVPTGLNHHDAATGTVYVVSVSGPKMYKLQAPPFMRQTSENLQLYQIIHIDGDRLRYEARTAAGVIHDAFTLQKRHGQRNELVEEFPGTEQAPQPAATNAP